MDSPKWNTSMDLIPCLVKKLLQHINVCKTHKHLSPFFSMRTCFAESLNRYFSQTQLRSRTQNLGESINLLVFCWQTLEWLRSWYLCLWIILQFFQSSRFSLLAKANEVLISFSWSWSLSLIYKLSQAHQ